MFVWSRFFNPCLQIALNCWSVAVPNIKQNLQQWPHLTRNNSAVVNSGHLQTYDWIAWLVGLITVHQTRTVAIKRYFAKELKSFKVYDSGLLLVVVTWNWKLLLEVLSTYRTFWWSSQQARLWKDSWLSKQKATNHRQLTTKHKCGLHPVVVRCLISVAQKVKESNLYLYVAILAESWQLVIHMQCKWLKMSWASWASWLGLWTTNRTHQIWQIFHFIVIGHHESWHVHAASSWYWCSMCRPDQEPEAPPIFPNACTTGQIRKRKSST